MTYLRRLPKFDYVGARTVEEACAALASRPAEAKCLAGGTDLIVQMRRRDIVPGLVVGLRKVAEMQFIRPEDGGLAIGSITTAREIERSTLVAERYPILSRTAAQMGGPEVRYAATIGGNLCGGLPCADFPPCLLTLGAEVKLQSTRGERTVALDDFYLDFEHTCLEPGELLKEIRIPPMGASSGGAYFKFHDRHAMDITTVGAAVVVRVAPAKKVLQEVRLALATGGPIPMRLKKAEAAARGAAITEEAFDEVAKQGCAEAKPRTSWRSSKEMRLEVTRTLIQRALREACRQALSTGAVA